MLLVKEALSLGVAPALAYWGSVFFGIYLDSEKKAKQSSVSDARRLRDWACMHSIKGFLKMTLATFKRRLYKAKEKQQNPTFAEHYFHDSFRSLKTFSFFHEAAFYLCIADLYH